MYIRSQNHDPAELESGHLASQKYKYPGIFILTDTTMAPSYATVLQHLKAEAHNQGSIYREHNHHHDHAEKCPSLLSSRRIASTPIHSPSTTPEFDTSAMDGYAVNSAATANATPESPAIFQVKGIMAAGDEPISVSENAEGGIFPCVEIMTGARFPDSDSDSFDCCVRLEDTDTVSFSGPRSEGRYIKVTKPVKPLQHRRLAGGDYREGDAIVSAGEVITPAHVMAMASVGVTELEVLRRPRIGVFSTGSELLKKDDATRPNSHRINDANGPYLMAVLGDWGVDVDFLDVLDDNADSMERSLRRHMSRKRYDAIISTGAVSTGRFDTIPDSLRRLDARVVFHGAAIRPGHPALFAILPSQDREIAYFGLPGNPVATAACLRFLLSPYLRLLQGRELERSLKARVRDEENGTERGRLISTFRADTDVFRPGIFSRSYDADLEVILIKEHSPGKIKPFAVSNCWIHVHRDRLELRDGDVVDIFPNNQI